MGYFAYDAVRYIESKLAGHARPDTLDTPDILLLLSEELAVVDNLSGKLYLIVYAALARLAHGSDGAAEAYKAAKKRLKELLANLRKPVEIPVEAPSKPGEAVSEFNEADFIEAVERAKRYIFDGDIMQVVLSQRYQQTLWRFAAGALSRAAQSQSFAIHVLLSLWRVSRGRRIAGDPGAAGRRHRDRTPHCRHPSARQNHTGRCSAGGRSAGRSERTCGTSDADGPGAQRCRAALRRPARSKVTENMQIEHYSHVMHIVSNVDGKLKPGLNAMDVLRATFPGGHRKRRPESAGDGNHR